MKDAAHVNAAHGGESIHAGVPSPADTSPAATAAGGLTGVGAIAHAACNSREVSPDGAVSAAPSGGFLPAHVAGGVALPTVQAPDAHPATEIVTGWLSDLPEQERRARVAEAERRWMIIWPIVQGRQRGEKWGRAAIDVHAKAHGITAATIYRWLGSYSEGGFNSLIDRNRSDKGAARVILSKEWEEFVAGTTLKDAQRAEIASEIVTVVRSLWASNSKAGAPMIELMASARLATLTANALGLPVEIVKDKCKVGRRMVDAEKRFRLVAIADQDGKQFYDSFTPSVRRTLAGMRPADVVLGDVTPLDIPILRPDGTTGYARVIAWLDAATRFLYATLYLPNAGAGVRREHVAASFADMAQNSPFGLPKRLYLDNGSEYQWTNMIDGWAELAALTHGAFGGAWGIESPDDYAQAGRVIRSTPYRPRGKNIEGVFGNLLHYISWVPGFIGSDRLRKKVATLGKGVDPQPLPEVREALAKAIHLYNCTPQSGELGGLSPTQAIEKALNDQWKPVKADAAQLALAFADRHECLVHAGKVRANGMDYYSPKLIGFSGQKVRVRQWRGMPQAAFVFVAGKLVDVARLDQRFAYLSADGAKEASQRRREARQAVQVLRGMVSALDPMELMHEAAMQANAGRVIDMAEARAVRVEISDEVQEMLDGLRAQAEKALEAAAPQRNEFLMNRTGNRDEEAEAVRAALGL